MATARLDILKNMVAQNPGDSFSRYGLAMEYRSAGNLEAAAGEFKTLAAADPDYIAAYYHYGQTLEALRREEEARAVYAAGLLAAVRKGDRHAQSELQAALDLMG